MKIGYIFTRTFFLALFLCLAYKCIQKFIDLQTNEMKISFCFVECRKLSHYLNIWFDRAEKTIIEKKNLERNNEKKRELL